LIGGDSIKANRREDQRKQTEKSRQARDDPFSAEFAGELSTLNPAILEADEGGIERTLVEIQVVLRDLLQASRDLVSVLSSHGRQGSQNDQVQRPLQKLERLFVFTKAF
jgi:hypothetical protein